MQRLCAGWLALMLTAVAGGGCGSDTVPATGSCQAGLVPCAGGCVDTATDPSNCGGCGVICAPDRVCSASQCAACAPGTTACDGRCADLQSDAANCGGCGKACAAGEACSAGACTSLCAGGSLCAGKCVDTSLDPSHCGGCDKPCPAGQLCSMGMCGLACLGGTTQCGDKCVDTSKDTSHCGGCDKPCVAGQLCLGGTCNLVCNPGFAFCGGKCVDTLVDPKHCGGCGKGCAPGEACTAGACACPNGLKSCPSGCVNLAADPSNCGSCAKTCGLGQICTGGICFTCDNTVKDGDETDVDCGGNLCEPCPAGKACLAASDCATLSCANNLCGYATSCAQILAGAPTAPDGLYFLDPDGPGGAAPLQTHCLMKILNGGWTLVQRTVWDFNLSSQLITTYAVFYAATIGSPDKDQAYRMAGKLWPSLNVAKDHLLVHTPRKQADGASCGSLYYTATNGTWTVPPGGGAAVTGTAQTVTFFNQDAFSTTDNGPSSGGCVNPCNAVPWTYTGCCTTCPTFACGYYSPAAPMVSYLTTPDQFGNDVATQCGADAPVISSGYYGLNSMAYYLR